MRDYGPANWDVPHRFVASYIYELPFFKKSSNGFLKYVLAGWQIAGVTTIQSGIPVNVTFARRPRQHRHRGPAAPEPHRRRARLNCQPNPTSARQLINCYDPSAFALPAQFTFGNAPRNILRGPKLVSTDLSLSRRWHWAGRRLQLRAEMFNVFNNVNFANPNGVCGPPTSAASAARRHAADAARREVAVLTPLTRTFCTTQAEL